MKFGKDTRENNMEKKEIIMKHNKSESMWHKSGKKAAFGAVGLSLLLQNMAFAAGGALELLRDIAATGDDNTESVLPVPVPAAVEHGLRLSISNSVPKDMQDQARALCILAMDVIASPTEAGARFTANPKGYMAERGISPDALDLNSREVKIVLALGDAEVRFAARNGDIRRYLGLLEERGILGYGASTDKVISSNKDQEVVAAVTAVAAFNVAVVVAAVFETATAVHSIQYFWGNRDEGSVLDGIEGKVTTLLWGHKATQEMMTGYISEKAEEWADAIFDLPAVKSKNLAKADIRKAIEQHLTDKLSK